MQAITGLTINLLSFTIPPKIICETDQLRVKIKTLPDGNKQKYDIKGKKMSNCNLIYTFNITNQTERLLFIFRKKTILSVSPVIGTANLDVSEIMESSNSSSTKMLDIYYPIERQLQEQQPHGTDRSSIKEKAIGQAKVSILLSGPHETVQNTSKSKDQKKQTKKDGAKPSNGNNYDDNLL